MTSIAALDAAELGGPRSVLSRQKRDHIELHRLLGELQSRSPEEAGPLLIRIYRLVFPHAFAEEAVLWPAIRRVLPDGHELTLQVEKEHQRINELVMRLEALPRGSAEWRAVVDEVIPLLLRDVRDEEDILLPRLRAAMTDGELRLLGTQWAFVRAIAPTRCHPLVSRRPPGNVLSALPLTLLDRTRDRLDARRYRNAGGNVLEERLSAGLTRAAQAVERLPGMKSGEDPSTRREEGTGMMWRTAGLSAAVILAARLLRRRRKQAGASA